MLKENGKIYSVSEITTIIKGLLEDNVGIIWIQGEISNLRIPGSGHVYFTLKDEYNQVKIAFFRASHRKLGFELKEGQKIKIFGQLSIYGQRSEYQIIAEEIELLGIGDLLVQFEKLKKKLESEGLFLDEHKKPIPAFPDKIGIITSQTGAALRDILNIIDRRYRNVEILIYPVLVQGEEAPEQIIGALKDMNEISAADIIILARGGGSIEDLWAFNDEKLAYAIYESKIPVISAIGHQIDFTIADFVADMRAPTPSAAAELVVPDSHELYENIVSYRKRLENTLDNIVLRYEEKLQGLAKSHAFKMPFDLYNEYVQKLDDVGMDFDRLIADKIKFTGDTIKTLKEKLAILNPLNILKKGYAVVYNEDKSILKDSRQVKPGKKLRPDCLKAL